MKRNVDMQLQQKIYGNQMSDIGNIITLISKDLHHQKA